MQALAAQKAAEAAERAAKAQHAAGVAAAIAAHTAAAARGREGLAATEKGTRDRRTVGEILRATELRAEENATSGKRARTAAGPP